MPLPVWAWIPSDLPADPYLQYNPSTTVQIQKCILYGLGGGWECNIEVQKCPKCAHREISPDCSTMDILNWNNQVLFMHNLLDNYTSSFSTSETPFVAWVTSVSRRYMTQLSQVPFVSDKLFRSAWFAYIQLVRFENDMICPECGPSPKVTIWDGVTLAFNRKHLLQTLQPPTSIFDGAYHKGKIRTQSGLQCLEGKDLRRSIREILD